MARQSPVDRGRATSRHRVRSAVAAVVAALLVAGTALAATPVVTVTTVGGQAVSGGSVKDPLTGSVTVTGTSASSGGAGTPALKPLVADAGDSSFVKIGQPALLVGAGFGGAEPYTFTWSAAAGTIEGADAPTASWNSAGLAAGTYTINLRVTDQRGQSASDTVKVAIFDPIPVTIFDQSKSDGTPGFLSTGIGAPDARIEWQIVRRNGAPSPDGWQTASGVSSWSFQFATSAYGNGAWTILVRRVEDDLEVARTTVAVKLK